MPYHLIRYVLPVFLVFIVLEWVLIRRRRGSTTGGRSPAFSRRESLASLGIAIGHRISNVMFGFIPLSMFAFTWEHRLATMPLDSVWAIGGLFLGTEFCYYWHHRAAHEVRWIWATHAVHHSAQHLNLSAAYRLGWTGWLSGNFLFFLPLCWIGFHPIAIAITLGLILQYQFWIHTELVPKLGLLEWVLNTPSHHRVHHAANPEYIDRNYGGVLIIFDRLFGTVAVEQPERPPIYGLTHPIGSHNPIKIAFFEWARLIQDVRRARTWPDRASILFGRPT
jgi:sterol desaturase/sphingolipid hydroxylase (fatty acid hydroxylase superfamily)